MTPPGTTSLRPSRGSEPLLAGGLREVEGDDWTFLRKGAEWKAARHSSKTARVVDLFSGAGGMSLGLHCAAQSLGIMLETALACDTDSAALACYRDNFGTNGTQLVDVRELFPGQFGDRITKVEKNLRKEIGSVDLLVGGPPCQGHSDLNNRTRRSDPKNSLYYVMARAAQLLAPKHIVIENVPGVVHDRMQVVQRTSDAFEREGYRVSSQVVNLLDYGVPQKRRRHLLIATRSNSGLDFPLRLPQCMDKERSVRWAIEDLFPVANSGSLVNKIANSSADTRRRMEYLFRKGLYELPNSERPKCHQRAHSYKSIYGRLCWDKPSQTITRGFYSMCMGRYVHPAEPRTLSAHEAARLQFFPDTFSFASVPNRTSLARIIGNAVPCKLAFLIGQAILPSVKG